MKSRAFNKTLSVFLSLLMAFGAVSLLGALPAASAATTETLTLLGRYFSTDNVWYDAAKRQNGIAWQEGAFPEYDGNLGMTYLNGTYVKIDNNNLFSGVNENTGFTVAFRYRPGFTGEHRHILSVGQSAYGAGTENQFFISGATSWYSGGRFPVVAWMDGNNEVIKAVPDGVGLTQGADYDIVITVDKDNGVVFYINGERKNTVYVDSNLNDQKNNIRNMLNAIGGYAYSYIGCSRWTSDAKIQGHLRDLRIFKGAASETLAGSLYTGVPCQSSASSDLVAQYFTTNDPWYNAVTGADGASLFLGAGVAVHPDAGFTYVRSSVLQLETDLFKNVTRDTGLTFSFNYRPDFAERHRHLISIGQNPYGSGTANHFFISGAYAHNSDGNLPMVEWVNGDSGEKIAAYPAGVPQEKGREYNIVVTVDKDEGVIFYVDGQRKTTVYAGSDLNGQIENIRAFLDEVNTYHYNYVGASRWTDDQKIEGSVSDLRIYQTSVDEAAAYEVIFDMIGTSFNLNRPSFTATAFHYTDPANGAFANLAYASPASSDNSGMGIRGEDNSEEFKDIYAVYFKFFTPLNVVMVYDGAHETYAPVQLETKRHDKANVQDQRIYYVVSNSSLLQTRHNWYGYNDSGTDPWKIWAGAHTDSQINTDTSQDWYVGSTNDTSRFWWNALKYTGGGNNETYYEHERNVSYTLQAFYDLTIGGTSKGTGTITTNSNYYVLNYKPVYNLLPAASTAYTDDMSGKQWMYTEASYAQAMLAMRRLTLCNPNLYNYGADVDKGAEICADAIKYALIDYSAINLVKKEATVHISAGAGTEIIVTNNGSPVADGDTVYYGDILSVSAAALSAYDQNAPAVTITGGTVNGNTTLVNTPDIYISSGDLALNTYTLTFDPNGGTLDGAASVTVTYTQPLPAAVPVSRDGYGFERYEYGSGSANYTYYNQNFENVHGNYDVKGDITVTAQWTPTVYSVTLLPGEGSVDAAALSNFGNTYTIEDTKALPTASAPTGYHFDGWTVAATNSGDAHGWGTEKIAQNAAVTGKWGSVTLTATYAPDTDTAYAVEYYEMGTDGAYPTAPTRVTDLTGTTGETAAADTTAPAGFTFDASNPGNVLSAPIAADGSTVLKVYLSRNRYTVSVTLGEGAALNVADGARYYYGETVTFNVTALTGYDPDSAVLTVNGETAANGATFTVEDDIDVVVSDLSLLRLSVTVAPGVGTRILGVTEGEYDYGASFTVSAEATDGYNPAGLKLRVNGTVVSTPYTFTLTADTVISTDDLNRYRRTVTVTAGAGTVVSGAGAYDYGDTVTVYAEGLEGFSGDVVLRLDGEVVPNPYVFTIVEDRDFTTDDRTPLVYHTVVFNNYNNTKLYEAQVLDGEAAVYAGDEPAKPDEGTHTFTFAGWDKPLENITETTVFTAQFTTVHDYSLTGYNENEHYIVCSQCGEVKEGSRIPHDPTTVTDVTATCDTNGKVHDECGCGYVSAQRDIGMNPDNHVKTSDTPAVTASCVTEGFTAGVFCSGCNTYISGHTSLGYDDTNHVNTEDTEAVTANCVTEGFTAGVYCNDCRTYVSGHTSTGYDYTEAGHDYGAWTSNGEGAHVKTCSRCAVDAENHTVSEDCCGGTATCSAKKVCDVCGEEYGELDDTNHVNTEDTEAVTANCVTEGFTAGVYCNDCRTYVSGHTSTGYDYTEAGHDYGAWTSNGEGAHVKTCSRCAVDAENHTVSEDCCGGAATCTAAAVCDVCGEPYGDALGHQWTVIWEWTDTETGASAAASFTCGRDPEHTATLIVADAPAVDSTGAQCGMAGSVTYRAEVTLDGVTYVDEHTVETDALPHLWIASWNWAEGYASATASFVCERDPGHTGTATDTAPVRVDVKDAACTEDATVKYTAEVVFDGHTFTTETEEIALANTRTGHTYEFVNWTWEEGHLSATAHFACVNCPATAQVTDEHPEQHTRITADCEHDQVVYYTADVVFKVSAAAYEEHYAVTSDDVTLAGTKTEHDWGETVYVWAQDNSSVTATRTCNTYASHTETETAAASYTEVTAPTYETAGEGKYAATFTNAGFAAAEKPVEIPSVKAQLEAVLTEAGSDVADIDAVLQNALKIVNGEAPYTEPYEADYITALSDLLDAFNNNKDNAEKVADLVAALESMDALADETQDHVVYTVTYILNGGSAANPASFVRTDAAFTLVNPTRSGHVFTGWTGTGLDGLTLNVTVDPADAENKTFTANWAVDDTEALAAIGNAEALIADADDEYEDSYSEALAGLTEELNNALAADPRDPEAIRALTDELNALIGQKGSYQHSYTVDIGYKEGCEPTCTEAGIRLMRCAGCDKTQEVAAPALGHSWGEWTVVTPADYDADGEEQRVCSRCGATESRALHITEEYDRQIRFNTVSKMYYVIEVGDGYNVYNSNTILWYSGAELKFHVYVYSNSGYASYDVYINGVKATPDANGTYTLPAGSTNDTVSVSAHSASAITPGNPGPGTSGECEYCGQTHDSSLWGRLIALIHAILNFFRNLVK